MASVCGLSARMRMCLLQGHSKPVNYPRLPGSCSQCDMFELMQVDPFQCVHAKPVRVSRRGLRHIDPISLCG